MPPQTRLYIIFFTLFLFFNLPLHAAQIMFTPALTLSEQYTDNVDLAPDDENEDFITSAGLTLSGQILGRTAGLELSYSPSYNKYQNNDTYDSWRHEASLLTWKEISRNTRLELRNTFLQTNDPSDETAEIDPDDPSQGAAIEPDSNRRSRNEYYTNIAEVRFDQQFGSDDSYSLACSYSILRAVDTPATAAGGTSEDTTDEDRRRDAVDDNDIITPSLGLVYNITTWWGVELDASYAITDYDAEVRNDRNQLDGQIRMLHNFNRTLSGFIAYSHTSVDFDKPDDEKFEIYRPSIGIRINFQDDAGITIDGGYYIQDFERSENEEGFNIDSDIYKRWAYGAGYFGIEGGSGYAIDDDGVEDNGLIIYYEGSIATGYQFTSRFSTNIGLSYRYADFPNDTPDRVDQTWEADAGIVWQALQWMSFGLSYGYTNVTSDLLSNEYEENRGIFSVRLIPVTPYRLN